MPSSRPSARACFLLLAELVVADQLGRLLQALLRADRVIRHRGRAGEGQLVPGDHVAAAELQRVDAQLLRDDVDHLLPAGGLHHPRPPVRAQAAGVGVHRLPAVGHRARPGPAVRAGEHHRRRPGHLAVGHHRVRADVLDVVRPARQQHAVLVGRRDDLQRLLAGVPAADQVLGPVLDPLHRPVAQDHGRHHDRLVLPGGERLLAERSAHIAHDHPDLILGDAQHPGVQQPLVVHALAGDGHLEAPAPTDPTRRSRPGSPSARTRTGAG